MKLQNECFISDATTVLNQEHLVLIFELADCTLIEYID